MIGKKLNPDVIIYSDYVKASGEHYCYICSYMDICHVMHISDIDTFIKEESDNLYALLKDSIEPYSELAKVSDVSAIDTKFVLPNKFYLRDNKPVYAVVVAAILNQFRDTHSHGVFRDNYSDVIAVVTHAVKVNEQQEWETELVFIEPDFFDDEDDDSNEAEPIDIELKDFEGEKVFADIKFPKIKEVNGLEKESDEVEIIFEDNPEIVKLTFYHEQECCEYVDLDDFELTTGSLVGGEILSIREETDSGNSKRDDGTWTFYIIDTTKGSLWMRWYGSSNGYYSERVDISLTLKSGQKLYH